MVALPLGRFAFGSSLSEAQDPRRKYFEYNGLDPDLSPEHMSFTNEMPKHDVAIGVPIAMGRNKVTREDWAAGVRDDRLDSANDWGLRHMSGNALEATRSCWSKRHLGLASSSRYLASTFQPLGCKRVTKGGFYSVGPELARPARRTRRGEDGWAVHLGFRVARDLREVAEDTD